MAKKAKKHNTQDLHLNRTGHASWDGVGAVIQSKWSTSRCSPGNANVTRLTPRAAPGVFDLDVRRCVPSGKHTMIQAAGGGRAEDTTAITLEGTVSINDCRNRLL